VKGIPTVLLVNEGSASASEILAGALHDNSAATIVGKKTYGKGVVQDVRTLRDGGSLKVTIASWYTPKGKNISKEGITPDHVIDLTEADVAAGRDPQKDKALELLK
jgi:carboxyl-terminal processing protease